MKHTPGPWRVEYFKWVRSEANGEQVCSGLGEIKYGRTNEEIELLAGANARLIAAAPDLLEACKTIRDYDWEKTDNTWAEICLILNLAIAKAEGR